MGTTEGSRPYLYGPALRPPFSASLRTLIQAHGLRADKSLGQHFLISERVISATVEAALALGAQTVLEIGPGPGVLTSPLSLAFPHVVAIELDSRMPPILSESAPSVRVLRGDALELEWAAALEGLPRPWALVSNMPYQITGPLLAKAQAHVDDFAGAVLMMQREVGDRITAPAGDERRGALTVGIESCFAVRSVAQVPPGCFMPPPRVDSVVLALTPRPDRQSPAERDNVHAWVKHGFRSPRKTLNNNIRDRLSALAWDHWLTQTGRDPRIRPRELTLSDWQAMAQAAETHPQ
jgi:16S rRNA (adenine1518-N6/adenine1519-N6)-dimethyltransferase